MWIYMHPDNCIPFDQSENATEGPMESLWVFCAFETLMYLTDDSDYAIIPLKLSSYTLVIQLNDFLMYCVSVSEK